MNFGARTAAWSIGGEHLVAPLRRFPTPTSPFIQLRKLGKPPSSFNVNSPDLRFTTVLHIMGAICGHLRGIGGGGVTGSSTVQRQMQTNWASYLGPWVEFLLEVVVSKAQEPTTEAGFDARDRILMFIPGFLDYTVSESDIVIDLPTLKRSSPNILPLFYQVWREVIALDHSTWGMWSILLSSIIPYMGNPASRLGVLNNFVNKLDKAPQEKDVGSLFIRRLNSIIPLVPVMALHQTPSVFHFLNLFVIIPEHRPWLLCQDHRGSVVIAVVKLASSCLYRQKSLRNTGNNEPLAGNFHRLAVVLLSYVMDIISGSAWMAKALDSGIIHALFKTYPFLLQHDNNSTELETKLSVAGTTLMDHISKYLLHSSVLHAFLRVMRRIERSKTLEKEMRGKSKSLWSAWERCKGKASVIREFRKGLRAKGFIFCTYEQCPLRQSSSNTRVGYFICMGCGIAVYCSRSCQKFDWKSDHRKLCREKKAGSGQINNYDYMFFQQWIYAFIYANPDAIRELSNRHLAILATRPDLQLSDDEKAIKNGRRSPIFYLNFNTSAFLTPENCFIVVINTGEWIKRVNPVVRSAAIGVVEKWKGRGEQGLATVLAVFAGENDNPYPVEETVQLLRKAAHMGGPLPDRQCITM
ncbi:hypothetical protein L218DRAFT_949514 [Marasmius fiardii PR-910]|nr:hypothetical protein L218DRAFT_949514 [Marasmius fiardii PR-910]